ncbi:MAG TPA: APC family permease [Pseudolysinimonas sp.]|nr:APC family permease [Pseudolysinimonas sp.]
MSTSTPEREVVADDAIAGDEITVDETHRLHGNLGTLQLVITVLAMNAPLGITVAVAPLVIAFGFGLNAPLLYLVLAAVIALFAVGYATMSRVIPRAGAFYTFITAGLGRPVGLGSGFLAIIVYTAGLAYTLLFVGITAETIFATTLNLTVPWWVGSIVIALVIAVLGYLRISSSVKVLGVLLALEVIAVLVYDAVVVFQGGSGDAVPGIFSFDPQFLTFAGIGLGAVLALTSFSGIETTAIFRDEVRDPRKTVPRATYIAVAIIGAFYAVQSWVIIQGFGAQNVLGAIFQNPAGAVVENIGTYLGAAGRDVVVILIVTSTFASLTSLHNVIARYAFNLARDGVLPKAFALPHPRFGSPYRASVVLSIVTLLFLVVVAVARLDPNTLFVQLSGSTGFALIVLFVLAAAAIVAYLARTKVAGANVWHRFVAPIVSAVILAGIAVFAAVNLDTVTSSTLYTGGPALNIAAIAVVVVSVLLGVIVALVVRTRNRAAYERIGTEHA